IVDEFQTLVHSRQPVPASATAVHGITNAELLGKPGLADVWPRFRGFVGDRILVVHNGYRFDVPLLRRLTAAWQGMEGLAIFDSLPLARNLFPGARLSLEQLAKRFGIDTG